MIFGRKQISRIVVLAVLAGLCSISVNAQVSSPFERYYNDDHGARTAVEAAGPLSDTANSVNIKVVGAGGVDLPSLIHVELTADEVIPSAGARVLIDGYCNDHGEYTFAMIPNGSYVVTASVAGFLPQRTQVRVDHGSVRSVMITLRPVGSTVDVSSDVNTVSISWLAVPEKARKRYIKANERFHKKDYEGTLKLLKEALEIDANFPHAYNEMGLVFWVQGKIPDAKECFRTALVKDDKLVEASLNLAEVLISEKQFPAAQQVLEEATQKSPTRPEPFFLLGHVLYAQGQFDKAETAAKQALDRDPTRAAEAHIVLSNVYLKRNDVSKVTEQLEAYLSAAPQGRYAKTAREHLNKLKAEQALSAQAAPAAPPATGTTALNAYTSSSVTGDSPR